MDKLTGVYYEAHAQEIADRYESVNSPVAQYFQSAFKPAGNVLEIGIGSGRDLSLLLQHGFNAVGLEPSPALSACALSHHPELKGRVMQGSLPVFENPFPQPVDAILCCAVLMHIPADKLDAAIQSMATVLADGGRVLLSLPLSRGDVQANRRDDKGRLFNDYSPALITAAFAQKGFKALWRKDTEDAMARAGNVWYTLLLEKQAALQQT